MKDAKMIHLESDIQKVQVKTNMYIHEYGKAGALHLAREIIQNSIDECLDKDSPGKTIEITYDKSSDILTCHDDGRGFSEKDYPLDIFCTTLQSGSKFFRDDGGSAGEFGVGLCVVNALSDYFEMVSYRQNEGTKHTIRFENGIKVYDNITKQKKPVHGCTVSFKTSSKYMGEDSILPIDDVITQLDDLFYLDSDRLIENNIVTKLSIYDGLKLINSVKFKPKEFKGLLYKILPPDCTKKNILDIVSFTGSKRFIENSKTLIDGNVENVDTEKELTMSVALTYITKIDSDNDAVYDTYSNYTNTINNGTHKDAFDEVFCRYMQNKINSNKNNKIKVTWDDIRTNLYCVINLSTNGQIGFVGNAKTEINCPHMLPYMKDLLNEKIDSFFSENKSVLDNYIKLIKLNTKARLEAQKIKVATQVEKIDTFAKHRLPNFIPCNNKGKQWKELFLTEGNSAAGSARNGCDPDTQAFFLLRGNTMNVMKGDLSDAMKNKEWHDLITVLGCGIGDKFNIDKLQFNRINILTDSDIDGYNITASILAFFYKYLKPVVEAGKLYKVYSPLYKLEGDRFVITKSEMTEIYHKEIVKHYKIKPELRDKFISNDELYDFLIDTYNYRENLIRAADQSGKINKYVVEIIIAYLSMSGIVNSEFDYMELDKVFEDQKFITSIMSFIQNKFKEAYYENNGRISIVIDGRRNILKINERLFKKCADLIPIYKKYGFYLDVKEKGKDDINTISIGEFLDITMKLIPKIATRYKGLGELNGTDLHKTTLDINNRISVQYTVDDAKKELDIFNITHGSNKDDVENRKNMMKEYKINREDLDN